MRKNIYEKTPKGFTLAEVLLTMTVIGIVATLTVPVLMESVQDMQLKILFKEDYSILDQATKKVMMDNGGDMTGIKTESEDGDVDIFSRYEKYLYYTKKCVSYWVACGYEDRIKGLNGQVDNNLWAHFILNNGTIIRLYSLSASCQYYGPQYMPVCGQIILDVNGAKGPNTYGKDVFWVWIVKDGIKPFGTQGDYYSNPANGVDGCTTGSTADNNWGFTCATKILLNKDY